MTKLLLKLFRLIINYHLFQVENFRSRWSTTLQRTFHLIIRFLLLISLNCCFVFKTENISNNWKSIWYDIQYAWMLYFIYFLRSQVGTSIYERFFFNFVVWFEPHIVFHTCPLGLALGKCVSIGSMKQSFACQKFVQTQSILSTGLQNQSHNNRFFCVLCSTHATNHIISSTVLDTLHWNWN